MTKIDIISGFLGAGKTTLIKKLLEEAFQGEKLVLIENEFGEIGIDGGFLKQAGVQITEMNSGCICCSLVGDFSTALQEVLEKYAPDRVIIEPSGVGKLSDVIKAVQKITPTVTVQLNSFTAVVDVKKCKMYMKNFGEFFNNQIENAQTIILSRSQDVNEERLEMAVNELREHNSSAVIITTPWNEISGVQILETMEKKNTLADQLFKQENICTCCGHNHSKEKECGHSHHEGHNHDDCCHENHEGHNHDDCCHENHEGHNHDDCCHEDHEEGHSHHHADEVFTSWGVETPHRYNRTDLENILKTLSEQDKYGIILRAKGILPSTEDEWFYFDFVPGEYEIRGGAADVTGRLCVIGSQLKESAISHLFQLD